MKFKLLIILLFFSSCASQLNQKYERASFTSKGFVYIYNHNDYNRKLISRKYDNKLILASHSKLKSGTYIKITNPTNNKSIKVKTKYKTNYPNFYKLLITQNLAENLDLDSEFPYLEIQEIKKNKSFIAKKAETFNEEKQIHNSAPIEKVNISNIGKIKIKKRINKKFSILVANFYSLETAKLLKKRLINETNILKKNIIINTQKKNNYKLIVGPYNSINLLKNDYIELENIGFEDLDIKLHG